MSLLGDRFRPHFQDWAMSMADDLRPPTIERIEGDVLEVGFGTGRNLRHYSSAVESLSALDPLLASPLPTHVEDRMANTPFPLERFSLSADGAMPFEDASFDSVVTTWTLCSIDRPRDALAEMFRVLKPGGHYYFVEHGRSADSRTAKWQDRLNPIWRHLADGCNMNRAIDDLVHKAGFELVEFDRFRHKGPAVLAQMYRAVATRPTSPRKEANPL